MLFSFFLDFVSFFVFGENSKRDTFGYNAARLLVCLFLALFLFVHAQLEKDFISLIASSFAAVTGVIGATQEIARGRKLPLIIFFLSSKALFSLVSTNEVESFAPNEINKHSKAEEFPFFYETLLNKEELVRYWNARNKGLNVAEEISQDFLTQQAPLRDFFLKNPQVCFVGVPEPSMMAFEPTRGLTRFIWSVPQAWYHERKHTCRIGLVVSHGDNDHVRFLASEKAIKGYSSDRWYSSEDVQKAYPNLDLLFVSCRGDRKPFYDDAIILEHSTGAWWSTEKGRSTHADWLWWVYNNGLLTKLVEMYSY